MKNLEVVIQIEMCSILHSFILIANGWDLPYNIRSKNDQFKMYLNERKLS